MGWVSLTFPVVRSSGLISRPAQPTHRVRGTRASSNSFASRYRVSQLLITAVAAQSFGTDLGILMSTNVMYTAVDLICLIF